MATRESNTAKESTESGCRRMRAGCVGSKRPGVVPCRMRGTAALFGNVLGDMWLREVERRDEGARDACGECGGYNGN